MEIDAVVHAKGTSERLPSKNKLMLGKHPLFTYAISNALNASMIRDVYIDSEDEDILHMGEHYGAIRLERPKELATNETTGDDLAYWQAQNINADIIVQVVPTSPFLRPTTIDKILERMVEGDKDSATTIERAGPYLWIDYEQKYYKDNVLLNSQSEDLAYVMAETTGFYAFKREFALNNKRRLNPESCLFYEISKFEAVNIDTFQDFEFALLIELGLQKYFEDRENGKLGSATVQEFTSR